jgi:hypothetical protein
VKRNNAFPEAKAMGEVNDIAKTLWPGESDDDNQSTQRRKFASND